MATSLAVQAGAKVVGRDMDDLLGDLVTATVLAGVSWRPTGRSGVDGTSRVGLGLRADVLGVLQSVSRSTAGGTSWERRFAPGADLMVELDLAIRRNVWLVASTGVEALVGPTDLWVGKRRVATVPALQLASELSVRFGL